MEDTIVITAAAFIAVVAISTWPRLGSSRSTDVLTGWKRKALLLTTALAAPLAATLAALVLMWHPTPGGRYAVNYTAARPGEQSLDPVVARLVAHITANPSAIQADRENPEWCRTLLKASATWEAGQRESASLGASIILAARQTVVLACLFRNDPHQINVNVGADPFEARRWEALVASLAPRLKGRVHLDYGADDNSKNLSTSSSPAQTGKGRTFTLTVAPGDDHGIGLHITSLLKECVDPSSPSRASLMMSHVVRSKDSSELTEEVVALTGPGWLALCPKQDEGAVRQKLRDFKVMTGPSVMIARDKGDSLLRYDPQTWNGLALTGVSTPVDWTGWRAEVTTAMNYPFILTARKPDVALILVNEKFCGFTDRADALPDERSALARAALMRSIDRLGAKLGQMEESEDAVLKAPKGDYVGPYLTQHELEELFTQSRTNLILGGTGLLSIALLFAMLHAVILILPSPTPETNRAGS